MPIRAPYPKYDARFMYIGDKIVNGDLGGDILSVPFPSSGAFETSRAVNAGRNIDNVVVGQQVGRSVDKQSMTWTALDRNKWWEINRWIEAHGMFFYCKYFSHNIGAWKIRRFYCGDAKSTPFKVDANTGIPKFYRDCSINVIDTGSSVDATVSRVNI